METKKKKIPFDLERAKRGEAFRLDEKDKSDTFYFGELDGVIFFYWFDRYEKRWEKGVPNKNWHHLIPDEPEPERWAVVHKSYICNTKEIAQFAHGKLFHSIDYTLVKLADDE